MLLEEVENRRGLLMTGSKSRGHSRRVSEVGNRLQRGSIKGEYRAIWGSESGW